jgi:nucleoside phosphorylase
MQPELRPLAKLVPLTSREVGDRVVHEGMIGDVELVATITTMGTAAAGATTEFVLRELDVEHVALIGIAGGLGDDIHIGDLLVPTVVIDHDTGQETHPTALDGRASTGRLVTSGELILDQEVLRRLAADGAAAIDMETSAVGAVCEREGVPWSVFRGISDHIRDGLIDNAVSGLANADGSANVGALIKYLAPRPWRMRRLAKLGRDMNAAASAAANALADALAPQ